MTPEILGVIAGKRKVVNSTASAIYDALVAYWQFEENNASATFLDSHSTNHLSIQTGTTPLASSACTGVGQTARGAFLGGTADRTAFCPRSNTTLDLTNVSTTFGGWQRGSYGAASTTAYWMGRVGSGTAMIQMYIFVQGSNQHLCLGISADGSAVTVLDSGYTVIAANSHFVTATLDRPNNVARLRIKGSDVDYNGTVAFASAIYTGASTANFCLNDGLYNDVSYTSGSRHMDGSCMHDQCFYMRGDGGALTDAGFDYLYNTTAGRTYAELATDAGH